MAWLHPGSGAVTILSAALLLEQAGRTEAARRIEEAVYADIAERSNGSSRSTGQIGDAIAARVTG